MSPETGDTLLRRLGMVNAFVIELMHVIAAWVLDFVLALLPTIGG